MYAHHYKFFTYCSSIYQSDVYCNFYQPIQYMMELFGGMSIACTWILLLPHIICLSNSFRTSLLLYQPLTLLWFTSRCHLCTGQEGNKHYPCFQNCTNGWYLLICLLVSVYSNVEYILYLLCSSVLLTLPSHLGTYYLCRMLHYTSPIWNHHLPIIRSSYQVYVASTPVTISTQHVNILHVQLVLYKVYLKSCSVSLSGFNSECYHSKISSLRLADMHACLGWPPIWAGYVFLICNDFTITTPVMGNNYCWRWFILLRFVFHALVAQCVYSVYV